MGTSPSESNYLKLINFSKLLNAKETEILTS